MRTTTSPSTPCTWRWCWAGLSRATGADARAGGGDLARCARISSQRNPGGARAQAWNPARSLARIGAEGCGILVLLAEREPPQRLLEQVSRLGQAGEQPKPPPFAQRALGVGAQILRDQGARKLRLLSQPVPYRNIAGFELEVAEFVRAGMSECGDLPAQAPGRTAQRLILRRGIANHQRRPQGPAAAERTNPCSAMPASAPACTASRPRHPATTTQDETRRASR
ncbi:hypothetical protein ACU4GD_05820 [Cupriavidus basilensis]